ncbi:MULTISPECIES: helix-turn-helix transcriptional regulator [Photorhabdus]|uniref:helix-turn-helix domain-containing protein n=2 Tax=Morganellaceae TaxID=1903414 RepID=UPI000A675C14|nr:MULTISPECIES: helix-turn-helix transcriptional regulator [Photorhabdus]
MSKVMTFREKLEAKKREKNPEFIKAFEETKQALDLHIQLQEEMRSWREQAGLTSAQVAERMGVKPPTISRLEKNADRASIERILKYASVCGIKEIKLTIAS